MSAVYGGATIANATNSQLLPAPTNKGVQGPIAFNRLTAANNEMWNPHIGLSQTKTVAATDSPKADYYALTATPGLGKDGAQIAWTITAGAGAWA